jgi:hypothetical protein
VINGGTNPITTGAKGDIIVPYDITITSWTILLDQSGSIQIDIWNDTYGNYPPTDADTITGGNEPSVTSDTDNQSSTLTGWTTSITGGTTLRFYVDSVSTATQATLILNYNLA